MNEVGGGWRRRRWVQTFVCDVMEFWQAVRDHVPDPQHWVGSILLLADKNALGCADCLSHAGGHIFCHYHIRRTSRCCRCTKTKIIDEYLYDKYCMDCLGAICGTCLRAAEAGSDIDLCANNDCYRTTPIAKQGPNKL